MAQDAAEYRLEQGGDGGLAEEAEADRGERDPDLRGGQVLVDVVHLVERELCAARPLLRRLLHARAARAHERELGRDEEPVQQDQDKQQD